MRAAEGIVGQAQLLEVSLHQAETDIEAARREQLLQEAVQQALVDLVVDATAVHHLAEQRAQRHPRDLFGWQVVTSLRRRVHPVVEHLGSGLEIGLAKLELLGPAERGVAQTLLEDGVQPGQQEVEARALGRLAVHARRRKVAQNTMQVGLDAGRRLKGEHLRLAQQGGRQLGMDLSGEEQTEARLRLQTVQRGLEGGQPARRQVHILEQHPGTAGSGRLHGLLGQMEALRTAERNGTILTRVSARGHRQVVHLEGGVVSVHRAEHERRLARALGLHHAQQ
mmetsp:Transcript_44662/g.112564  ORF Transcript_44662/g.112564 Transcript_44662/m.112564 type:complete len:281 (+) Transcript_44662:1133-1975(+)